ncbi:MAG: prefoldin subunit alpha [Candidatus Aenigmatarchaeota archaeon]
MADAKKEMQEKAMMYQILNSHLEEISSHFLAINEKILEVDVAKNALSELSKAGDGSEMLVPVGAGCYGFGKLGKKGKFMVEIGAGFVAEKTLAGALESMEARKHELQHLQDRVKTELQNLRGNMDRIGLELNEMAGGNETGAAALGSAPQEKGNAARKNEDDDDGIFVE